MVQMKKPRFVVAACSIPWCSVWRSFDMSCRCVRAHSWAGACYMSSGVVPRHRSPVSSHLKNSAPPRSAKSVRAPTRKVQSLKSTSQNVRSPWLAKPQVRRSSRGLTTAPTNPSGKSPFVKRTTLNSVLDFFHIQSLSNASFEEAIFLHLLYQSFVTQLETLAAILPESLQRPLRALRAALHESDKNCSARNATRTRP
jgi:hypothetical protein